MGKVAGDEAGATDESAIDVGLGHEFGGVGGFDATTVLDADFLGGWGVGDFGEDFADEGVGALGLFRGSGATGADGPNGFVGEDRLGEGLGIEIGETSAELFFEDFLDETGVAFREGFADTDDGLEGGFVGGLGFEIDHGIGLTEEGAAFAVAEDDIADKEFAEHGSADFASESSAFFPMDILGAEFDILDIIQASGDSGQGGEGWSDDDIEAFFVGDFEEEGIEVGVSLPEGHVHLPIGCDDFAAHSGGRWSSVSLLVVESGHAWK